MRSTGLLVLLVLAVSGCGDSPDTAAPTPTGSGAPSAKRVMTVPEAIHAGDQPVKVRGYVLIGADGEARICTGLAGSYPPQCGSPSLRVEGLEPATIPGLESSGGIQWSGETTLRGTLAAAVLTIG